MSTNVNQNSNIGVVAGASAVGAGVGGATAYFKTSFYKNNAPTDKFVNQVVDKMAKLSGEKKYQGAFIGCQKFLKKMEKITDLAGIKNLLKKFKHVKDVLIDIDVINKNILNIKDFSTKKRGLETAANKFIEGMRDYVKTGLEKIWDNKSKKIKSNLSLKGEDKTFFEACDSVFKKMKLKSAGIYGSIGAVVAGGLTYLLTRKSTPKVTDDLTA